MANFSKSAIYAVSFCLFIWLGIFRRGQTYTVLSQAAKDQKQVCIRGLGTHTRSEIFCGQIVSHTRLRTTLAVVIDQLSSPNLGVCAFRFCVVIAFYLRCSSVRQRVKWKDR